MELSYKKSNSWQLAAIGAVVLATVALNEIAAEPPDSQRSKSTKIHPKAATPDDIKKWIAELSDDAFPIRQSAATRLLSAGTPARDALVTVADGADPEARAAARRLIALIDRTEFNHKLEAFAADIDGKRGLTLPGWERFRKLVGSDPLARALFVDMQRAEGALISAAFGVSSQPPEELWEERLTRLVSWQVMNSKGAVVPQLGSSATMVFLGAVPEFDVSDRAAGLVENLIQRPPIRETLPADAPQNAVRRLVVAWILHCPNKSEVILASRLQLIAAINLKGGLPLALDVASSDQKYPHINATTRALALLIVGQFGSPEHVEKLEPLLEDARVCMPLQVAQPNQPMPTVQVRDVALCVMLQLTDQKPSDYGYLHARLPPQRIFDIRSLHAANDEVRADAAAKWKAWRDSKKGQAVLKPQDVELDGRQPVASEK